MSRSIYPKLLWKTQQTHGTFGHRTCPTEDPKEISFAPYGSSKPEVEEGSIKMWETSSASPQSTSAIHPKVEGTTSAFRPYPPFLTDLKVLVKNKAQRRNIRQEKSELESTEREPQSPPPMANLQSSNGQTRPNWNSKEIASKNLTTGKKEIPAPNLGGTISDGYTTDCGMARRSRKGAFIPFSPGNIERRSFNKYYSNVIPFSRHVVDLEEDKASGNFSMSRHQSSICLGENSFQKPNAFGRDFYVGNFDNEEENGASSTPGNRRYQSCVSLRGNSFKMHNAYDRDRYDSNSGMASKRSIHRNSRVNDPENASKAVNIDGGNLYRRFSKPSKTTDHVPDGYMTDLPISRSASMPTNEAKMNKRSMFPKPDNERNRNVNQSHSIPERKPSTKSWMYCDKFLVVPRESVPPELLNAMKDQVIDPKISEPNLHIQTETESSTESGSPPQSPREAEKQTETVCTRCDKNVYMAERRVAAGKAYHTRCFTCISCGKPLDSAHLFEHNCEIYCKFCYRRSLYENR